MGHLWLRSEYKEFERRTPLIPEHAEFLIDMGHKVTVEESRQRVFSEKLYKMAGCEIVSSGAWEQSPHNAYILGLKNIPELEHPLRHKHIYFAHSFKAQLHSKRLLRRFRKGGGVLYDLEYLLDDKNKRVAAFGFYAGIAGAAIALLAWGLKVQGKQPPYNIKHLYMDKNKLVDEIQRLINCLGRQPSVLVIGANGRSGCGANELLKQVGINATCWAREDTRRDGITSEILNYDILLNCIFVDKSSPVFLHKDDLLKINKRLSVISDISCEYESKFNPLPFYNEPTSFEKPVKTISGVDLIAIDNLPSYLPIDSSIHFSGQLIQHLKVLLDGEINNSVWVRADETFREYAMNYIIENRMINHYENSNTKKYYNYR